MALLRQMGAAPRQVVGRDEERIDPCDVAKLALVASAAASQARAQGRRRSEVPNDAPSSQNASSGTSASASASSAKPASKGEVTLRPLRCTATKMDGTEVELHLDTTQTVEMARNQVSAKLGVNAGRIRLLLDDQMLAPKDLVADVGIIDDCNLTIVILPPIYGRINSQSLEIPDSVITAKLDMHDDLRSAWSAARAGGAQGE